MTPAHDRPPGRLLLGVARRLFSASVVTTVVEPAVADLQHEVREAKTAARRTWVRMRGYAAIWTLMAAVPFSAFPPERRGAGTPFVMHEPADGEILVLFTALCIPLGLIVYSIAAPLMFAGLLAGMTVAFGLHAWHDRRRKQPPLTRSRRHTLDVQFVLIPAGSHTAGVLFAALAVVLVFVTWAPGLALALAAAAGATALATHDWHSRHPSRLPARRPGAPRHPEINFASIQVMENSAGLLVVVGSVAILAAGLPAFRVLLLATILMGVAVAAVLGAWRLHHPTRISVENSIALR